MTITSVGMHAEDLSPHTRQVGREIVQPLMGTSRVPRNMKHRESSVQKVETMYPGLQKNSKGSTIPKVSSGNSPGDQQQVNNWTCCYSPVYYLVGKEEQTTQVYYRMDELWKYSEWKNHIWYDPIHKKWPNQKRDWWSGSAGKWACGQSLQPEFYPWDLHDWRTG